MLSLVASDISDGAALAIAGEMAENVFRFTVEAILETKGYLNPKPFSRVKNTRWKNPW